MNSSLCDLKEKKNCHNKMPFTNHRSQDTPFFSATSLHDSPRVCDGHTGDDETQQRESWLLSADHCVLLCDTVFHAVRIATKVFCFTLCWLIASKHLESVVSASVVCTSIKSKELQYMEAHARYVSSIQQGGTQECRKQESVTVAFIVSH